MTTAHEQLYRRSLLALVAAGVPFVVIGTFALRSHAPALPRRLVHDCDIQLPPDPTVLRALVTVLEALGWHLTLWEQPLPQPLCADVLAGKYYLRARQRGAVLDCAYENDFQPWAGFAARCQWHHGLPLQPLADILSHKARCARPADLVVLRWVAIHLPTAATYNDSHLTITTVTH